MAGRLSRLLVALALATGVVTFAFLGLRAAGASAAPTAADCALPGSNFQGGDGNENTPTMEEQTFCMNEMLPVPTRDWQDIAKTVTNMPDPNAEDNGFHGSNKETEPGKWSFITSKNGVSPPKDNIISGWSQVDPQPKGTFLYLAFEREASTGDTFLTFELNQVKGLWENEEKAMIPCRTTGDVLISYNVPKTGEVNVVIYRWKTTAFKETTTTEDPNLHECATAGEFTPEEGTPVEPPLSQGNMNFTENIPNFLEDKGNPPPLGGIPPEFEAGKFGEAAVNLKGFFEKEKLGRCFSFGQMWMSSRSSVSISSSLQDFVSPVPLQATDCPAIETSATPEVTVGGKIKDEATLKNLSNTLAASKVTFSAFNNAKCQGAPLFESEPVAVPEGTTGEAKVSMSPTNEFTTKAAGTITWKAVYSGDTNNEKVEVCDGPGETTTVNKAKPAIVTSATSVEEVGESIKDVATLSGLVNPTGAGIVRFRLFSDSKCEDPVTSFESGPITANGEVPSEPPYPTTAPGTFYWIATYTGDANNEPAATKCGDAGESSIVEIAQPVITTAASTPVTVGANIKDTATLSGLDRPTGAGTVTFRLYSDSECKTEVFSFTSGGITANGNVPSGEYTTKAAGSYYWIASFSGDVNNKPAATKCGDGGETSVVEKAQPQITTSPTSGVTVGANIKDTATLSGLVNPTGTGTVTFKLYSDSECKTQVFSSASGGISANGTVASGEFATSEARTYYWIATYSGDANNKEVSSVCGAEAAVVGKATPSIVTTQQPASGTLGATFKDGATISGLFGAKPGGSVSWKLYSTSKCEGLVATDGPVAVSANGAYATPSGAAPKTAGTYYWVATYSGDANNNEVSSACSAEPVVVNPPPVKPLEPVVPATATAHGPSECAVSNASVYVTGRQIKSVTFYLDGHKIKTVTRPDKKGRYLVNIDVRKLGFGVHRVKMVVVFQPGSTASSASGSARAAAKSKTMNVVVARCRPPRPVFTG